MKSNESRNGSPSELPRINSRSLFSELNRVVIEHQGTEYLLQVTRQGKLILTK